jgi:hypothetical protein
MSASMQLHSSIVWVFHWPEIINPKTLESRWVYCFAMHAPCGHYHHHIWNCSCQECARYRVFESYREVDLSEKYAHWDFGNRDSTALIISIPLQPVWLDRLFNKTLDRWLEEDVKDSDLVQTLPLPIVRLIAGYALEPIVPGIDETDVTTEKPAIYLDSDKVCDFRVNDDDGSRVCYDKECTCIKKKK